MSTPRTAFLLLILCLVTLTSAQVSESAPPRLVRFSGKVASPQVGNVVGIRFAIYGQQEGGAALWQEIQNVELQNGAFDAMLGAASKEGIPVELFHSGETRWLGVKIENEEEQPRVLLVSVPYAFKAGDAAMLGGRPATDYMLAGGARSATGPRVAAVEGEETPQAAVNTTTGTTNFVAKFLDNAGNIGNSKLFDNGTNVGLGTTSPTNLLHVSGINNFQIAAFESTTATNSGISIRNSAQNWIVGVRGDIAHNFNLRSATTGVNALLISPSGNVGIGMSAAPTRKLQVVGFGDLQLASFESAVDGNVGFGFRTPVQNWGVGNRFDLGNAFAIRNITSGDDSLVVRTSGNVGVGVTNPETRLHVAGTGTFATGIAVSSLGSGVTFPDLTIQTTAGISMAGSDARYLQLSGGALAGNNTSSVLAVQQSGASVTEPTVESPPAAAILADATATSGFAAGVIGRVTGNDNYGLIGLNIAATPEEGDGGGGVLGLAVGPHLVGVTGESDATTGSGIGVFGQTRSGSGIGVQGRNAAETGVAVGVDGRSESTSGIGVQGYAPMNGTTVGVFGHVNSSTGVGGRFRNDHTSGLILQGLNSDQVRFTVDGQGNVSATGNLSVTGNITGSFTGTLGGGVNVPFSQVTSVPSFARRDQINNFSFSQSIAGNVTITGLGNGLVFPDGSVQTTAATGGGSTILSGTMTLNTGIGGFPSIIQGSCNDATATVTGATSSMVAVMSPTVDPSTRGTGWDKVQWTSWVSANNTVTARFCKQATGSASLSQSLSFNVRVIP